jgi:hypothetical protein
MQSPRSGPVLTCSSEAKRLQEEDDAESLPDSDSVDWSQPENGFEASDDVADNSKSDDSTTLPPAPVQSSNSTPKGSTEDRGVELDDTLENESETEAKAAAAVELELETEDVVSGDAPFHHLLHPHHLATSVSAPHTTCQKPSANTLRARLAADTSSRPKTWSLTILLSHHPLLHHLEPSPSAQHKTSRKTPRAQASTR